MARVDVVMPQMGESIAEGTLSKWLKKVGDAVKRDEPIFEISTDKVDAEIPSPVGRRARRDDRHRRADGRGADGRGADRDGEGRGHCGGAAPRAGARRCRRSSGGPPPNSKLRRRARRRVPPFHRACHRRDRRQRLSRSGSAPNRRRSCERSPPSTASRSRGLQGTGIAGRVTKRDICSRTWRRARRAAAAPLDARAGSASNSMAPLPEPWPGDRRRADVQDPRADQRPHGRRAAHAAHVTSFFEIDLTRVRGSAQKCARAVREPRRARS